MKRVPKGRPTRLTAKNAENTKRNPGLFVIFVFFAVNVLAVPSGRKASHRSPSTRSVAAWSMTIGGGRRRQGDLDGQLRISLGGEHDDVPRQHALPALQIHG